MSVLESLRKLRHLCGMTGGGTDDPEYLATSMANALDSSLDSSLLNQSLPLLSRTGMWFSSEAQICRWIDIAFTDMFTLWPFIDRQTFTAEVHHLFEQGKSSRDGVDNDHLGLLHAVIALGQRNDPELTSEGTEAFSAGEIRGYAHHTL